MVTEGGENESGRAAGEGAGGSYAVLCPGISLHVYIMHTVAAVIIAFSATCSYRSLLISKMKHRDAALEAARNHLEPHISTLKLTMRCPNEHCAGVLVSIIL